MTLWLDPVSVRRGGTNRLKNPGPDGAAGGSAAGDLVTARWSQRPSAAPREIPSACSSCAEWKKRPKQAGYGIRDRKGERAIQERKDWTLDHVYCLPRRP